MDSVREISQFRQRRLDLPLRLVESRSRGAAGADPALQQLDLQRKRDEPLLRAVVQVSLETLTLPLSGLEHAGPRAPHLLESRGELRVQPTVLEGDTGSRADGFQELRLVVQSRIVEQRRDVHAVAIDPR